MSARCLSHDDGCMNYLEVSENGHLVRYTGRGRDDSEAASIRSNAQLAPIPTPIGYFEAYIVDKGRDGYMSVGVMNKKTHLDKLVGWGEGAIGYHGDDGNLFVGNGMGRPFGPLYSTGDTIGCGLDWINGNVFFTKNGSLVGSVPHKFADDEHVFAAIGLRTPGETIRVNFGLYSFVFDLKAYLSDCRQKALKYNLPPVSPTQSQILDLILSHCIYYGYVDTVEYLLKQNDNYEVKKEELSRPMNTRLLQLKFLAALDDRSSSLTGVEIAFPQLMQDDGLQKYNNFMFVQYLQSQKGNAEGLLQKIKDMDGRVDERVLALLAYSENLGFERPQEIIDSIITEFKEFLLNHSNVENTLYVTLQGISSRMESNDGDSIKSRRLWQLLNCQYLFFPSSFFDDE